MKLSFSTIALPGASAQELTSLAKRHSMALEARTGADGYSLLGIPFE